MPKFPTARPRVAETPPSRRVAGTRTHHHFLLTLPDVSDSASGWGSDRGHAKADDSPNADALHRKLPDDLMSADGDRDDLRNDQPVESSRRREHLVADRATFRSQPNLPHESPPTDAENATVAGDEPLGGLPELSAEEPSAERTPESSQSVPTVDGAWYRQIAPTWLHGRGPVLGLVAVGLLLMWLVVGSMQGRRPDDALHLDPEATLVQLGTEVPVPSSASPAFPEMPAPPVLSGEPSSPSTNAMPPDGQLAAAPAAIPRTDMAQDSQPEFSGPNLAGPPAPASDRVTPPAVSAPTPAQAPAGTAAIAGQAPTGQPQQPIASAAPRQEPSSYPTTDPRNYLYPQEMPFLQLTPAQGAEAVNPVASDVNSSAATTPSQLQGHIQRASSGIAR